MEDQEFMWNSRKPGRKQHLRGPHGKTFCKLENGFSATRRPLDVVSKEQHPERGVCAVCIHMLAKSVRKPKKASKARKQPKKNGGSANQFLSSREWKEIRYRALKRSNGRCQCCGRGPADGAVLNVDHIKPRHKYPELALDINNLQVLCGSCNSGKGGWDETDWREPLLSVVMGERMAE